VAQISGKDCLNWLSVNGTEDIQCVMLDIEMPEQDGLEVRQDILALAPELPILLMSGYAKHTLLDRFPEGENVAFIQKPFTPQRLVDEISALTTGQTTVG
ncbi:MAG: response regulator, partial [Pseudomonadota bacterium]